MNDVAISFGDDVDDLAHLACYQHDHLNQVLNHLLAYIHKKTHDGLALPYFIFEETFSEKDWAAFSKSLNIYVCGTDEGQALNLDARGKDYATNILSYPNHLSNDMFKMMGQIPLGELVICHDVVVREANEQDKTLHHHLIHLIVHGVLHLLGFDHELGQDEAEQMEYFEIEILSELHIANPYE